MALRNFVKTSYSLLRPRKCVTNSKNSWHVELYFGTKIQTPSPPKRPLSAYLLFCQENRKNILKENPALASPTLMKILAEKWNQLSHELKEPYEMSARQSTLSYGEAHKKFYENLSEEQKEQLTRLKAEKRESRRILRLKKALRDSGVPKKPCSAYAHFVKAQAECVHDTRPLSEFIKKTAEMWKSLSEESKQVYETLALTDKERYAKEFTEWQDKVVSERKLNLITAFEEVHGKRKLLDINVFRRKQKVMATEKGGTESEVPKN